LSNPNNPVVILCSRWSLAIVPIEGTVLFELIVVLLCETCSMSYCL